MNVLENTMLTLSVSPHCPFPLLQVKYDELRRSYEERERELKEKNRQHIKDERAFWYTKLEEEGAKHAREKAALSAEIEVLKETLKSVEMKVIHILLRPFNALPTVCHILYFILYLSTPPKSQ